MNYFMIDNLNLGGTERQASYLINNKLSFDKIILLENKQEYVLSTNIPINYINSDSVKIYQRSFVDRNTIRKMNKKLTKNDTVISFMDRSNLINIRSSLINKHKAIISVRNYLSERYKNPKYFYRFNLIKKYYPKADLIVTNSKESKKDLIKNFNIRENKIKVIYNSIDFDNISILKKEKLPLEHEHIFKKPTIINIGSLSPEKCQKQLIEAFSEVKKYNPEYQLVIIGKGKLEQELHEVIKKLNLQNDVFLIGTVKNPFKYIYKSIMFVLTSSTEGFPNVLLESFAVGTPIVSKNCLSGPSELMMADDYNNKENLLTDFGYLTPRKNNDSHIETNKIAESISNLIKMKNENNALYAELQKNCINRAKEFKIDEIILEWEELIN